MNTKEKFWEKVDVAEDCWLWTGRIHRGYGRFFDGKRDWTAHRLSWAWAYFPLPDDICLDHVCGNKACVRPDRTHLEPVTWAENSRRAHVASRSARLVPRATPARSDETLVRPIPDTPESRAYFDRRVVRGEHWTIGSKQQRGTPPLLIDGKLWQTHHLAYAWWVGPLREDELVLRGCDVPTCVRPEHLRAVDRAGHLRARMNTGLGAWRAQHSTSADERAAKAQAKAEEDARLEGKAAAIRTLAAGLRRSGS